MNDRRNPQWGWVNPSPSDNAINDARAGFMVPVIARRNELDEETVEDVLMRAYSYGFLTTDEIYACGVDIDPNEKAVA